MKNEYPIDNSYKSLSDKLKDKNGLYLSFHGGDLGIRKNIDNIDDIYKSIQKGKNYFVEHNLLNNDKKLNEFYLYVTYQVPQINEYEYLLKNKKYPNNEDPIPENNFHFDLASYNEKSKNLFISNSILEFSDEHFISLIVENLVSVKKALFTDTVVDCSEIFESKEGNYWNYNIDYKSRPKHITEYLKQQKWEHTFLDIENQFLDKGRFKNHLDSMLEARKFVDPKVKFEISGATEQEKKLLKLAGL